jgi:hypothetical protein
VSVGREVTVSVGGGAAVLVGGCVAVSVGMRGTAVAVGGSDVLVGVGGAAVAVGRTGEAVGSTGAQLARNRMGNSSDTAIIGRRSDMTSLPWLFRQVFLFTQSRSWQRDNLSSTASNEPIAECLIKHGNSHISGAMGGTNLLDIQR